VSDDPVETRLDEIAKLLTLLVSRERSLQDIIGDLSGVGIGPTRIAELTGTSVGYAKVAVDRARKKSAAKGAKAAKA
jgi:hypothetical protein